MVSKTYAEYKGKIYTWLELLEKWNYYHNEHSNARPEVYKQVSAKRLEDLKCMIKDDDGEFVEICNNCEELIDDCDCGNEEEVCDGCGELVDDCVCEEEIDRVKGKTISKGYGKFEITTNADSVSVYKNGNLLQSSNKNPYTFNLVPGVYGIRFIKCGYKEVFTEGFVIKKNKITEVEGNLTELISSNNSKIKNSVELMKSQIEKNKLQNEKLEQETLEKNQKLEQEKLEKLREENRQRLEKDESDRQKLEQEKLLQERIEKSRKLEQEKLQKEEQEKLEAWRLSDKENCEKKNYINIGNKYLVRPDNRDSSDIKYNTNGNGDESDSYTEPNGKKIRTYARLSNRECIKWVELLQRCNLYHNPRRSAYEEWREYIKKDSNLPKVDRVDSSGNIIQDKGTRPIVKQSDKIDIWTGYFPNTLKGICPCCKDLKNNEINFGWFIVGHNIPFSKGGSSELDNLVPICGECNNGMGDRYTIVEYREKLKRAKSLKLELDN